MTTIVMRLVRRLFWQRFYKLIIEYDDETMKNLKCEEKRAIQLADSEENKIDEALSILSKMIKDYPQYASAYNNR